MTGGGVTVWCESVDRLTGEIRSRVPMFLPASAPAGYAERLCARLTECGVTDWRVAPPEPGKDKA